MAKFIPVSDDELYDNPQLFDLLVPYHVDYPCRHRLAATPHHTPADLQSDMRAAPINTRYQETGHEK